MIHTEFGHNAGGHYVEWYNDDDGTYARWYGTRAACEARAQEPVPPKADFWPVTVEGCPHYGGPDTPEL
jgi:hypothetical protein